MTGHVHVIPIPDGMSVDEAFTEIMVMGHLVDAEVGEDGTGGCWATVTCDGSCGE